MQSKHFLIGYWQSVIIVLIYFTIIDVFKNKNTQYNNNHTSLLTDIQSKDRITIPLQKTPMP